MFSENQKKGTVTRISKKGKKGRGGDTSFHDLYLSFRIDSKSVSTKKGVKINKNNLNMYSSLAQVDSIKLFLNLLASIL